MSILAQSVPTDISGWLTGSAVTVLAFGIVPLRRAVGFPDA